MKLKKIAIFKPFNARHNNAFKTGQYELFKSINELPEYDITFFIDDESVKFKGVRNIYIKKRKIATFYVRLLRKFFGLHYAKIPYYGNLNFNDFDIVITEGIHYVFLKYFFDYRGKLILNDSITSKKMIKNLNSKLVNKIFKNSTSVIVNEKIKKLYLLNSIFLNTKTIGHYVQTDKIEFVKRYNHNFKILSVGRLVEEKGFIFIFSAIKKLVEKYPKIQLDIYGDGPLEIFLEKFIKVNKLNENIFLRGEISYEDLLRRLKNYDLFVSHSIELENVAEAFHMGNMEAMSSGMPVITTNCGGIPFVVGDSALICDQRSISQIVQYIDKVFSDSELFNILSVNGRKFVEKNFSKHVIIKKWLDVLD